MGQITTTNYGCIYQMNCNRSADLTGRENGQVGQHHEVGIGAIRKPASLHNKPGSSCLQSPILLIGRCQLGRLSGLPGMRTVELD